MRSTLNVCMVAGPHQLASCLKMQPDLLDKKKIMVMFMTMMMMMSLIKLIEIWVIDLQK